MINKQFLCNVFFKGIEINTALLIFYKNLIKNKLVKYKIARYRENVKIGDMYLCATMFNNVLLCTYYTLSELFKFHYMILLFFNSMSYIYFFKTVNWIQKFILCSACNIDNIQVTGYFLININN